MEFESSENRKAPRTLICVVHDDNGRIVHGHVFVGDGDTGVFSARGKAARERETLDGARRNHGDMVSSLRVFHAPATFRFDPETAYRVDVAAGRLVEADASQVRPVRKSPVTKKGAGKGTAARTTRRR